MKDWHWFLILGSVMITPFLPLLLKSKCMSCGKRKLQSIDTLRLCPEGGDGSPTYLTFYKCDHCGQHFKRNRTGAYETSSREEFNMTSEAANLALRGQPD